MFNKQLKIFFLLYLTSYLPCFSQSKHDALKADSILKAFNKYISAVHLDELIKATDFKYEDQFQYTGTLGQTNLTAVYVLTLEPGESFADPSQFAVAWKKVLRVLKGKANIYGQQFLRLSAYTGMAPDSLVIRLKTKKPNLFSFIIYYDGSIKINESLTEIKGSSDFSVRVNPDKDFPFDGFFQGLPYSADLPRKLITSISSFLKTDENGKTYKKASISIKNRNDNYIVFSAANLNGKITQKFYDLIKLYVSIIPSADQKTVDIAYNFSVRYGSEPYSASASTNNYEDAIKRYSLGMARFSENLRQLIDRTAHAKSSH